ncbi:uncharacterized protein LOC144431259 [Styela clava]
MWKCCLDTIEGRKCKGIEVTRDLSGDVESPTTNSECLPRWAYCSWEFHFPTDPRHTMFRMTFTTNFVQTERNLIQMGGGFEPSCCWKSDLVNFKSVNDKICWITYNSDLCLDRIKQSGCETRDWGINVTHTMVLYKRQPAKARFNLIYEYIDCITGNRIESPETTSQPTTYQSLQPTTHSKPTTTVAETTRNIKTPFSHYGITNTVNEPSISSQAIEDYQDDPITMSPQTMGMIIGMVVLAFILQITACKAYFYWKNSNRRTQEEENQINTFAVNRPLPDPSSALLYEEVENPVLRTEAGPTPQITISMNNARYIAHTDVNTSRPRNNQASSQPAMAPSSQGNTIESTETTSQPTTYPPLTTTVAETAENIKTPSSHYGITNTVTEPSISSQATDDCKNDPMTISPQTIGMIIGMIVMAFILQITAFKAYFYWKNRNRSQERQHQINTRAMNSPLPVPTPTPLYEEVNNPLPVTEVGATSQITIPIDNAVYLSPINVKTSRTRNTQASPQAVRASSSQGEYEVAYVNAPESDYITPETLP